jgi:hypothetical protein
VFLYGNTFKQMIVTSFPRSGSTYYCMNLAKELGYTFYDEIFESGKMHKNSLGLHEINLDTEYPKTPAYIKSIDLSTAVVNNHEINYFSLERTDIFLSRHNVQDSIWSYLAYSKKLTLYGFNIIKEAAFNRSF